MTLQPLTGRTDIMEAYRKVTDSLQTNIHTWTRMIGYHGGRHEQDVHWHEGYRFWWLLDSEQEPKKHWCCYGIENPEDCGMLSITVETNSPYEGTNKRLGGLFVRDRNHNVYVAHTGNVGGGRAGIGKAAFWQVFGGEQVETVLWPDGKESQVLIIGRVGGERLQAHVATFVHRVARFKVIAASGKSLVDKDQLRGAFTPEFEGPRRSYTLAGKIEGQCDHGTIVNRMHDVLKGAGHCVGNDRRDLYIQDHNRVTHLFEVKTDTSTTSIYMSIGQLMLYGALEDPTPRRILVIPNKPKTETRMALERLGIDVLVYEWNDGQVICPRLEDLLG